MIKRCRSISGGITLKISHRRQQVCNNDNDLLIFKDGSGKVEMKNKPFSVLRSL